MNTISSLKLKLGETDFVTLKSRLSSTYRGPISACLLQNLSFKSLEQKKEKEKFIILMLNTVCERNLVNLFQE
jgi:hypothetical protein